MADAKINIIDLVELQFIENALSACFSAIEKLKGNPELSEALKKQQQSNSNLDEIKSSYHELDVKRKKLEDTVGINEEKIKSNGKKLFSGTITDPKELSNYQGEIDSLKKSNSKMEDDILELMEEQEKFETSMDVLKKELDGLDILIKRINSEIGEKQEGLKHNIEGLKKRKEDVLVRIPEEYLKKYNDMKTKKGGIAVSVIKDHFCGVCNMEIPAIDTENFVDSEVLYKCPVCGRLSVLYRPEIDDIKKELE